MHHKLHLFEFESMTSQIFAVLSVGWLIVKPHSLETQRFVRMILLCVLQVDLLKSTALPLMKKFGIDGESFELKVRTAK